MPYTVYVLKNRSGKLYKGISTCVERRLEQHNRGLARWTKGKGPFVVAYTEEYESKTEALMREKFLKSGKGREFLKTIV